MSDAHLSQLTFESLDITESLKRGIAELGFTRCTPIQAQTLPIALAGRDVAGQAQTGTGKTAAFLIALFNRLLTDPAAPTRPRNAPRAIVIAPTRELAVQIHSDAEGIGKHTDLKLAIVFGGVDYEKQRRSLEEGVDVLIGTPGRIIDYFKQHVFELRHIQVAVMDEADRMFDLGFIKDIRFILRRLPHPTLRLNMMFSATLSHRVLELAYEHMNNPELIRIEPDKMTVDRVRQVLYFPATEEKVPLLVGLLRRIDARRTMVFVNTKRVAELLERTLTANGFVAQAISGDVPQAKRLRMMRDFHNGDLAVLVATDVASRGLHIPDVSHVINYDLPNDAEDYVHRIGRTARAGAEGDAISFGCEEYAIGLPDIEGYIGHQIPRAAIEAVDLAAVTQPPPPEWRERAPRFGNSRGGRPGSGGSGRGAPPGRRRGPSGPRPQSGSSSRSHPGRASSDGAPAAGGASAPGGSASAGSGASASAGGNAPTSPDRARAPGSAQAQGGASPSGERPRRRRRRGRGGGGGNGSGGGSGSGGGGSGGNAPGGGAT
ncbi:MAG TPA: DEAD/DEAH box helicase [Steroidobacteraceae bacterium]|jgi:ATP-dependent RNA helicase RhlB|nr:DEAD/DEAH box helicase [Steroidobacteraceae bacterium]